MINSNISGFSSMSAVKAKVEIYDLDNSLVTTCTCGDFLQSYQVSREPETDKFFGFGICQKLDLNLIDLERQLTNLSEGQTVEIYLGDGTTWDKPYPTFYIDTLDRDEKNNTIKAVCYDALYSVNEIKVSDLNLKAPYTIGDMIYRISTRLGLNGVTYRTNILPYNIKFPSGANFDADSEETGRAVLNYASELVYSIYFINYENKLVFKSITNFDTPDITITNNDYFELTTSTVKSLANIGCATELGENLSTESDFEGVTQYFRENPFLTAPEILYMNEAIDVAGLLTVIANELGAKASATGYVDLTQFYCDWGGNYLLEPGDRLALTGSDGTNKYAILLNDSITYDGALSEITEWTFTDNKTETFSNPVSIGEKLNQTFARVDKIEKNITLYIGDVVDEIIPGKIDEATSGLVEDVESLKGDVSRHTETITSLELTTGGITAQVSDLEQTTTDLSDELTTLGSKQTTIEENVAALQIKADGITTTVSQVQSTVDTKASVDDINTLRNEVSAKVTSDQVEFIIASELSEGIDKVTTTSKRYTFNDEGLDISSSDSNISTTITEDGMTIKRQGTEVLVADNKGVKAEDLHATTYLIIGNNSRLEDFIDAEGKHRTACFWIGG